MSSNSKGKSNSPSWKSDYCYGQGYDAASGNYEPFTG